MKRIWIWVIIGIVVLGGVGVGIWYFLKSQAAVINCSTVSVYSSADYDGTSACLAVGKFNEADLIEKGFTSGNEISSINIPSGYIATIYSDDNFTSTPRELQENVPNLFNIPWFGGVQPTWNDKVKSIEVAPAPTCAITAYSAADFAGVNSCFAIGNYLQADLVKKGFSEDDKISSIKVPAGSKVTAYMNGDYTGLSTVFIEDNRNLANGIPTVVNGETLDIIFNDKISSMKVEAASNPPTTEVTLTASPTTVSSGGSVTLTWANATSTCTATPSGWFEPTKPNGTATVKPTATTTYKLTCGSVSKEATVTVSAATGSVSLEASSNDIESGDSVTLSWTITGIPGYLDAGSCTETPNGWLPTSPGLTGSATVTPTETTTYSLTCSSWSDQVTVTVGEEITTCSAPTTETRTQTCPTGQTGTITQTRTKGGAPTCAWGNWTTTSNTCIGTTTTTTTTTGSTSTTTGTTTTASTGPETPLVAGGVLSVILGAYYLIKRRLG